ncbi:nuclear transport factor 2 family protein [Geodermatophilus sp. SYSU D00710]
MTGNRSGIETVERMVAACNAAAAAGLGAEEAAARTLRVFDEFYASDVRWVEAPTPFFPAGRSGGRAELDAAVRGVSARLDERHYTLLDAFAAADRVAAEYLWEATYREDGRRLRIRLVTLYRLRDGRCAELHEYPCVESLPST